MRTGAEDFADLGQQRCEEQQHQRGIATLRRRAAPRRSPRLRDRSKLGGRMKSIETDPVA